MDTAEGIINDKGETGMKILVINGPNLNFLGIREPGIYGNDSYEALVSAVENKGKELGAETEVFQSNHEGDIVDRLQKAYMEKTDGIVINPGGLTHTSVALHDAIASVAPIPVIEVHISNVAAREDFRHISLTAPACKGQIAGMGIRGYLYAMEELMAIFNGI